MKSANSAPDGDQNYLHVSYDGTGSVRLMLREQAVIDHTLLELDIGNDAVRVQILDHAEGLVLIGIHRHGTVFAGSPEAAATIIKIENPKDR